MNVENIIIREYADGDFQEIERIHDEARKSELALAGLDDAFVPLKIAAVEEDLFEYEVHVATIDDEVVGFIAFEPEEIAWLYADPNRPRQGIGKALIEYALQHTTDPAIEVLSGNTAAINLYEYFKFEIVETVRGRMPGNEEFQVEVHVMKR